MSDVKLYFVHPDTKGRALMRVPTSKADAVRAVFREEGYREVSAEEYLRFVHRWPLSELDEDEEEYDEDEEDEE